MYFPNRELSAIVHILAAHKLSAFMRKHPQARNSLAAWQKEAEGAQWRQWADIKAHYPTADWLGTRSEGHRVIFNIKGTDYRLVALVFFHKGAIVIERVGTHAQYDRWKL